MQYAFYVVQWTALSALGSLLFVGSAVAATQAFSNPTLGLTVVASEVDLPAGEWAVAAIGPANALDQAFLVRRGTADAATAGRRVQVSETDKRIESGRWQIQRLFFPCRDYAVSHGGTGPSSFGDVDQKKFGNLASNLARSPWPEDASKTVTGPVRSTSSSPAFRSRRPRLRVLLLPDPRHRSCSSCGLTSMTESTGCSSPTEAPSAGRSIRR